MIFPEPSSLIDGSPKSLFAVKADSFTAGHRGRVSGLGQSCLAEHRW
jgi:hypothetical protein